MNADARLQTLLSEAAHLARAHPVARDLIGVELTDLAYAGSGPNTVHAVALLLCQPDPTSSQTKTQTKTVHEAARAFDWKQSYNDRSDSALLTIAFWRRGGLLRQPALEAAA